MSQQGGNGKLRNLREEKLHKITHVLDQEKIVYNVQQEEDSKAKTRIFHRNMSMRCDELLENFH